MMCTVVKKLGKELEPAVYPVGVNFVHRVLVKTDTGVEARADISDRLYEKVQPVTGSGSWIPAMRTERSLACAPRTGQAFLAEPGVTPRGRPSLSSTVCCLRGEVNGRFNSVAWPR